MEQIWIDLDSLGITTQPFVMVATVDGELRSYIYYFEEVI